MYRGQICPRGFSTVKKTLFFSPFFFLRGEKTFFSKHSETAEKNGVGGELRCSPCFSSESWNIAHRGYVVRTKWAAQLGGASNYFSQSKLYFINSGLSTWTERQWCQAHVEKWSHLVTIQSSYLLPNGTAANCQIYGIRQNKILQQTVVVNEGLPYLFLGMCLLAMVTRWIFNWEDSGSQKQAAAALGVQKQYVCVVFFLTFVYSNGMFFFSFVYSNEKKKEKKTLLYQGVMTGSHLRAPNERHITVPASAHVTVQRI